MSVAVIACQRRYAGKAHCLAALNVAHDETDVFSACAGFPGGCDHFEGLVDQDVLLRVGDVLDSFKEVFRLLFSLGFVGHLRNFWCYRRAV